MRAEVVSASQDYESPAGVTSLMARIAPPNNLKKAFHFIAQSGSAHFFCRVQSAGSLIFQCIQA